MTNPQPLDRGVLSIPNRTKNINRDLDKYKSEQAKIAKRERADKRFLASEREAARKPAYAQAEALYKQHGKMLRARIKDQIYGTGNTAAEWLKVEMRVNPERFIEMVNQILKEIEDEKEL